MEKVVAVTLTGDTTMYKKYFNGEETYILKDNREIQCPLLFKYTSTEDGNIQRLHSCAINHGKKRKISSYEDEFPSAWRTNGRAYVNWVVGPKEVQQNKKGIEVLIYFDNNLFLIRVYQYYTDNSTEMKRWKDAIQENVNNLRLIAEDNPITTVKEIIRPINVTQMVTWMLYAASVHDDFLLYQRYPMVNLITHDYFTTPIKKEKQVLLDVESCTSSSTLFSTSSSSSSYSSSSS
jgi:hypothetical protein